MTKYRSIVALALAFVMVVMLSFASPAEAKTKKKKQVYTAAQIETIRDYEADINVMRDRLSDLGALIEKEDWVFARNFIHGPLGELRFKMLGIAKELFPETATKARDVTRTVFNQLNLIDKASADKDYRAAKKAFGEMNKNIEVFLALLPQG
jgi:photosystem II protein PsbQ